MKILTIHSSSFEHHNELVNHFHDLCAKYLNIFLLIDLLVRVENYAEFHSHSSFQIALSQHLLAQLDLLVCWCVFRVDKLQKGCGALGVLSLQFD